MSRTVRATYRVQLSPTAGLDRAASLVPYLARLGVSHLYLSPLFEATPGSTHGYDVTDHQRVRDELGGDPALRRVWRALDDHEMGMIVDLVPNHMGIRDPSNRWWRSVLRDGPESPFAGHFDIDWSPPDPASAGKVVLPFLDRPLDDALRDGAIRVERGAETLDLEVRHHGERWPASERSLAVLGLAAGDCAERVDGALEGLHRSPAAMARFLDAQHWRAVHWRDGPALSNWRRFLDVADLAAVRVELPDVFDDVHLLLRRWVTHDELAARVVQGVRVDHVDGLVDPEGYLTRLRELVGPDRVVLVEKILGATEQLPGSWSVDGTTGYEVAARIGEALTDPRGATRLRALATAFSGSDEPWPQLELRCRHLVADHLLVPEVDRATRSFVDAIEAAPGSRPHPGAARDVVAGLAVGLGVYRAYPGSGPAGAPDPGREELAAATARLRERRPDLDPDLVGRAHDLLVTPHRSRPTADDFAVRFGQLTASLAAKAVEDTAFYREVGLPWLAEVGADPQRTSVPLEAIHTALAAVAATRPATLGVLSTHDTKRSGDVRARLCCLGADPEAFATAVRSWHDAARPYRTRPWPDPPMEWLLWTTLVGTWPIDSSRVAGFLTKAMREAKVHSTWTDPRPRYEAATQAFAAGVLADEALVASIERFVSTIRRPGRASSLVQVALAATAAGPPDLYQGDEVWNLSLVDPDNRRPVDHDRLAHLLDEVSGGVDLAEVWQASADDPDDAGLVKLALWHRLLSVRRDHPHAVTGPYRPLPTSGPTSDGLLAFTRGDALAIVAPVRPPGVEPGTPGATVSLPPGSWHDVASGATTAGGPQPVTALLPRFPVAVLVRA